MNLLFSLAKPRHSFKKWVVAGTANQRGGPSDSTPQAGPVCGKPHLGRTTALETWSAPCASWRSELFFRGFSTINLVPLVQTGVLDRRGEMHPMTPKWF